MSITSPRRALGLLLTAALIVTMAAVPALAKPPTGTAAVTVVDSFDDHELYAGSAEQVFEVTVENPLTTDAATVNWVQIDPPDIFTVVDGSGPGDWEANVRPDGSRVIFSGGTLLPGSSMTFDVTANVGRPDADLSLPWVVSASDDDGRTTAKYDPDFDGALSPVIRVLRVVDNRFTAPPEVLDGDGTARQSVDGIATIENLASGALDVTPHLSGEGFTDPSVPGTVNIASQTQVDVPWSVQLADDGTAQVVADASAELPYPSDAPVSQATDTIDILTAAVFAYIDGTLSPEVVVPGNDVQFSLQLENMGEVDVTTIDPAASSFDFATFSAPLESPTSMEGQSQALFTFARTTVPDTIADGTYEPTVTLAGTDQNGVAVSQTIDVTDLLTLDSNAPLVDVGVLLPVPAVAGEEPAATSDRDFQIEGTVTDASQLCGDCDVSGKVVMFDAAGNEIGDESVPVTNDGGDIRATINIQFVAGTVAARVDVTAVDTAGLPGTGSTDLFTVDLDPPHESTAETGGTDGRDFRRIDITLDERVAFPADLRTTDFDVDGNLVTDVDYADSAGIGNNDPDVQGNDHPIGDRIILTLGRDLDEDATPVVRFRPAINDRPHDRVFLELGNFEIEAIDGIIPDIVNVDEIGGLEELDDRFYTNQSAPEMVVSNVTEGHRIRVWEDTNGNGAVDGEDRKVGEQVVMSDSGSETVPLDDLGGTDRELVLLTRATDSGGNSGPLTETDLTLDFTAPEFLQVATDAGAQTVQVSFDEPLRDGRNHAADWVAEVLERGHYVAMSIEEVSGDAVTASRTLQLEEDGWDGTVDRLRYDFLGSEDDRYIDRAGNKLVNFITAF